MKIIPTTFKIASLFFISSGFIGCFASTDDVKSLQDRVTKLELAGRGIAQPPAGLYGPQAPANPYAMQPGGPRPPMPGQPPAQPAAYPGYPQQPPAQQPAYPGYPPPAAAYPTYPQQPPAQQPAYPGYPQQPQLPYGQTPPPGPYSPPHA